MGRVVGGIDKNESQRSLFGKMRRRKRHKDLKDALPGGNFRFIALDVGASCADSASIYEIGLTYVGLNLF